MKKTRRDKKEERRKAMLAVVGHMEGPSRIL